MHEEKQANTTFHKDGVCPELERSRPLVFSTVAFAARFAAWIEAGFAAGCAWNVPQNVPLRCRGVDAS